MPRDLRLLVIASLLALPLAAGPCVTDTLFNYESLPLTGCSLGPYNMKSFLFGPNTAGGGATLALDTQITVTPVNNGGGVFSLNFSSPIWAMGVTGSQFTTYQIAYFWDPGPIRSMADVLFDPAVAPGKTQISSIGCLGANFTPGPVCPTSNTASVLVFDDGLSPVRSNVAYFSSVTQMGVIDNIDLHANGASTNLLSYGGFVNIPEPACALPMCLALAAFLRWRRR